MSNDKDETRKYEELYHLAQRVFSDTKDRFFRLEEKVARHLTVVGLFLVLYGIAFKIIYEELFPPNDIVDYVLLVLLLVVLVIVILTVWYLLKSLQVEGIKRPIIDDGMFKFFNQNEYINIIYGLTKSYANATKENIATTECKIPNISRAHRLIQLSVLLLGVVFFIILLQLFLVKPYPKDHFGKENSHDIQQEQTNGTRAQETIQTGH